jgi:TRAP-type C4-dicarboxylate transport system substrate-binding protein
MNKTTLILFLFLLGSLNTLSAYALTLKIATLAPAGTSWMKEMKKGAEVIKEKSSGRVKIKFYPGGVMGNDQSVHRKIRINQLQGGAFSSSGLTYVDSSIQVYSLPMLFNSFAEVDHVRARMDEKIKQKMADSGFIILGITEGGFARIMSTKPISTMQEFRNSKVWIPEGDTQVQQTFKTMGINPISLPISDVFTGLQTGLIDTITASSTGAIAFQWHTKVSTMVNTPVLYLIGILAVDKKAFDKIKPDDQKIVINEMNQVFTTLDKLNREDNINATAALETQGIKLVSPSDAEIKSWKAYSQQSIQTMIESGSIEKNIVDEIQDLLNAFRNP